MTGPAPTFEATMPPGARPVVEWLRLQPGTRFDLASTGTAGRYRIGRAGPVVVRRVLDQLALAHMAKVEWNPATVALLHDWSDHTRKQIVVWPWSDWPMCSAGGTELNRARCNAPAVFGEPMIRGGRLAGYQHRCERCVDNAAALPYVRASIQ